MADADFDDVDGGYGPSGAGGRFQRMINLAGAATSVALVVGLGLWGYRLAVRDVSGVPVVRALEGPMRVAPNDPGGSVADHQGLSVNTVAAAGTAAPPADRLVLAPRPVELTLEDTAGLGVTEGGTVDVAAEAAAGGASLTEVSMAVPVDPVAPTEPVLSESLSPTDIAVAMALADELAATAGDVPLPAPEGAISLSPRPRLRPEAAPRQEDPSIALPLPAIDPATLQPGARLIQLGAFDSAPEAEEAWLRLQARFGPLLTGKSLVVQAAQSGGSTFYRLRAAGFEDEDEARRLCDALMPDHDNCIPVTHR